MKKTMTLLVCALLLAGCDDAERIPAGSEGGSCLPDGGCDGDLVCSAGTCVVLAEGLCGNGVLESGEECESASGVEGSCSDYGYAAGALVCGDDCLLDFSGCEDGCGNGVIDPGEECDGDDLGEMSCEALGHRGGSLRCTAACTYNEATCMPQLARINTNVDILFVIDDSLSMEEEQELLRSNFQSLLNTMREGIGFLPNVHIGVTTTDLGAGPFSISSCEGGLGGHLVKGRGSACNNPVNQMYLVDVDPAGCTITRDASGMCVETDCAQVNCDAAAFMNPQTGISTEPAGLSLVTDDKGCPRCVNYAGETIDQVFSCMADVGVGGCGFEQPMEAMHAALTAGYPENDGFLRETAYLAVVFVTDEDDCSAADDTIFDPSLAEPPLTSFRCALSGVACAEAWDTLDATDADLVDFSVCTSAEPGTVTNDWLYHMERYIQALEQVKGSAALVSVNAVAGPFGGTLTVGHDPMGGWSLTPSCTSSTGGVAYPAVRIRQLVDYFNDDSQMSWAFTPICSADYSPLLVGVGDRVVGVMGY